MPSGLFYLILLDRSTSYIGVSGWFLFLTSFVEISIFKENIVDPDQAPRSRSTLFLNVPFTERQA